MKRQVLLLVMLVVSVAINVTLAHKLNRFNRLVNARSSELLKSGTRVPSFEAVDLGGHRETLAYDKVSNSTVLYVFTPPCSWCARNMDNFKTLLDKERGHYRFIGVSLSGEGLPEYVGKNGLNLPVYSGLLPETLKTYKLGSTPQTIIISPEGQVIQNWVGAYVGDQKSQVEAFFHVSLPGLRELPKAEAAKN